MKSWPSNRGPCNAKKTSFGRIVRLSIENPPTIPDSVLWKSPSMVPRHPSEISFTVHIGSLPFDRNRRSVVNRSSPQARRQRRPGDLPIVEREPFPSDDLIILVSLSCDHDRVARFRQTDRPLDRLPPVRDHLIIGRRRSEPGFDLPDDRERLLAPGVVGGQNRFPAQPGRDGPHLGTLPPVPVSAAAEYGDDPARREIADRLKEALQRVLGMGIIDDDGEVLTEIDLLEPARNPAHRRDAG